jgi:hypothetical protein
MRADKVILLLVASACGGSDGGYGNAIRLDAETKSRLVDIVDSTVRATTAASLCDGAGIGALESIFDGAPVIIAAKLGKSLESSLPALRAASDAGGLNIPPVSCVAGMVSATYDHYRVGAATINGKLTLNDSGFAIDLSSTVNTISINATVVISGAITVSPTAITGEYEIAADALVNGTTERDYFSMSHDLRLTNGCATGGQIETHLEHTEAGTNAGDGLAFVATVVYGPACGDVAVY